MEVIDGGPLTTVQDFPGRVGYWHVGVPPNGPMDDLAHRLANRMVGNDSTAAALELTSSGPILRFTEAAVIALSGAEMPVRIDGTIVRSRGPLYVAAGAVVQIGAIAGAGLRSYLAVRGGIEVEPYLGSRATFTLGCYGGFDGRALQAGDVVEFGDESRCIADPAPLAAGLTPALVHDWELGVLVGPHAAPDYITTKGMDEFLRATWTVHFNSARTGVRLVGPKPLWARSSGGEAGLHPSNIHDTGYALGAVDITGDTPVILGPDGPSLGGFVCPAVVVAAQRWKLGQLRPGDRVRLVAVSAESAALQHSRQQQWIARATTPIEPVARPSWNTRLRAAAQPGDAVLARRDDVDSDHPGVSYRRAGDRFLLVEYGPMTLDLELRARVHALEQWVAANLDGVIDATAGVRSLLVQVDGETRGVSSALSALQRAEDELGAVREMEFESRVVHLPLSWDDPSTRVAIDRYMHGVRPDAPWCPWNIEFIRRINGLASAGDVYDTVFSARYLVLGLGDVYLGAPVATPLDPRHRLVTTKYNPARTWTPENAVGIGGAYLCIYGMEGPGGYQLVGRTVQVWNRDARGPHFDQPWLLRNFDQIQFHPVSAEELMEQRDAQSRGELGICCETTKFRLSEQRCFLYEHREEITAFKARQQAAFDEERRAWAAAGEVA
jgi:urea carboxylase